MDIKFRVANVRSAATEAALASLSVAESPAQRRPQRTSEYSVAQKAGLGEMVAKLGLSPAGAALAPCCTWGLTTRALFSIVSLRRLQQTRV